MNNNEQSVSIDHLNTHLPSNLPLAYSSTYQHVKRCTLQSRLGKNIKNKKVEIMVKGGVVEVSIADERILH